MNNNAQPGTRLKAASDLLTDAIIVNTPTHKQAVVSIIAWRMLTINEIATILFGHLPKGAVEVDRGEKTVAINFHPL